LGCDYIATGHYARIQQRADGRWLLKKGIDETKDQSYVLYMMTQELLAHTRFPLGELRKTQVRQIAQERGLLNAKKRDSQDICFVPDGDYGAFIRRYTGRDYPGGDFVDECGKVLGRHHGLIDYTIGQRRGLGVAAAHPLYVCRKCMEDNTVVLTGNEQLFSATLRARDINLIDRDTIAEPTRCKAKIRYKHTEQPCTVTQTGPDELRVVFDEPQRAITDGQAVVLYDGDSVIGGGTIFGTMEER
jgi:tRNA-specific 2-thiouridylase